MGILSKLFRVPDKKFLIDRINNGAMLLDVRPEEEFKAGHVKRSINIPVSQITRQYNTFNKEKSIVVVCASGARSAEVVRFLNKNGYQAYNGGDWMTFKDLDSL